MGLDARKPDFGAFEQLVILLHVKFKLVSVAEQTCLSFFSQNGLNVSYHLFKPERPSWDFKCMEWNVIIDIE